MLSDFDQQLCEHLERNIFCNSRSDVGGMDRLEVQKEWASCLFAVYVAALPSLTSVSINLVSSVSVKLKRRWQVVKKHLKNGGLLTLKNDQHLSA